MLKSFAGGQVFGGTWGRGPATVLALHGWRRTHQDFSPVFDPIDPDAAGEPVAGGPVAAGRRPFAPAVAVVAPDLFGFGATPAPPEAWGSEEYAAHLLALFEEPGVLAERVVLVGHSFGGRVSIPLYGLVPDRIERVVLTAVPLLDRQGRRSTPPAAFRMARALHRVGLVSETRMEAMRNTYGSPDYRAAQGVMRAVFVRLLAEEYADGMSKVDCPVDLVWGADDTEVPPEVAERARGMFPAARLTLLPGVGHLTPTEAPQALASVILGAGPGDDLIPTPREAPDGPPGGGR